MAFKIQSGGNENQKNYFMWPTVSFPFIICPIFKPNCQDFK